MVNDVPLVITPSVSNNYGDIIAALAIGTKLAENHTSLFADDPTFKSRLADIAHQFPIKYVSDVSEKFTFIDIRTTYSNMARIIKNINAKKTICVSEYDYLDINPSKKLLRSLPDDSVSDRFSIDVPTNTFCIKSGLSFAGYPNIIETGIYDPGLDFSINESSSKQDILAFKKKTLEILVKKKSWANPIVEKCEDLLLSADWSLLYSSDIGNEWPLLDIFHYTQKSFSVPKVLFNFSKDASNVSFEQKCRTRDFTYYSSTNRYTASSSIVAFDLGVSSMDLFDAVLVASNGLSLVTGDNSFTKMLSKTENGVFAPFLYHCPSWKKRLFYSFTDLIGKEDVVSADTLRAYHQLSTHAGDYTPYFLNNAGDYTRYFSNEHELLCSLVVDSDTKSRYKHALLSLEKNFTNERRNAGIENANILWSLNKTLDYVIEHRDNSEAIATLMPKR